MNQRFVEQPVRQADPLADFRGGTEWMVDASRCDGQSLRDLNRITSICQRVIIDLGLTVVGEPMIHAFPGPGGVTALYLLSESHLACHTYPEHGFATFNLYCCRRRPEWSWRDELSGLLGAEEVVVRELRRDVRMWPEEASR
jgi:S-adenosylmethionine decarboxylase